MMPPNDTPELNASILSLFRRDVASQIALLEEHLDQLQAGMDREMSLRALISAAHAIGGAAFIIHFESCAALAKAFEFFFRDLQHNHREINFPLLSEGIEHFKTISRLDDRELEGRIRQRMDPALSQLAHSISESVSKPQPEKEIEVGVPVVLPPVFPLEQFTEEETADNSAMMDLFRIELENQAKTLINGIVSIEQGENVAEQFDAMLRAAHSIKGAAQIVCLQPIVRLTHVMEETIAAMRNEPSILSKELIDKLLNAVDVFTRLSHISQPLISGWVGREKSSIINLSKELSSFLSKSAKGEGKKLSASIEEQRGNEQLTETPLQERVLRVTAQRLNRLMELAGESLIESRRLYPINESMIRLKKSLNELTSLVETFKDRLGDTVISEVQETYWEILHRKAAECQNMLNKRLPDLSAHISRYSMLTDQLYDNVIDSRMRPFGDAVESFPRLVRDLAQRLNKKVRLSVIGKTTPVDRDILEKLEAPLAHLLRNAIDHGIELPEKRIALGKPPEGMVRVEARHQAGMLFVSVFDDGGGVDIEDVRKRIIDKGLMNSEMVDRLTESELVDFLFLSGFSTTEQVTEISGRGIGLNAVKQMIHEVAGSIRTEFIPGKGMRFNMLLPLTLSVVRVLVVEIARELYAVPLTRIERLFLISRDKLETIEKIQYFNHEGNNIGLVWASKMLDVSEEEEIPLILSVILLKERKNLYGVVVDRLVGEKELVVRELDPRLGTIAYISAGAIMEDGSPILIIDTENLIDRIPIEKGK